ncbi:penicillin-binding protein 2 [Helicobacter sp. 23-1045]
MDTKYKIILSFMGAILLIIAARLYYIAIIKHEHFVSIAQKNIIRVEMQIPARGQILDRNNKPLAVNELGYAIALNPYLGRKKNEAKLEGEILRIIAHFPHFEAQNLKEIYLSKYSPYNHHPITIIDFIPYSEMLKSYTQLSQSDNIRITNATKRHYPNDTMASHIIGYIGSANQQEIYDNEMAKYTGLVGKIGIERYYNDFLQGKLGYIRTKVDVLNRNVEILEEVGANRRFDMNLALDIDLQRHLDSQFEGKAGATIVMDATNGEILAAGSYPEYNLNDFVNGMNEEQWSAIRDSPATPLLNKMINGMYPPGSVIKMGLGLSFLEYGDIDERTIIETPPFVEIGGVRFRDWSEKHGSADLIKALRRSVDVYFYRLSYKIGIENMAKTLKTMGLGEKTGIDLIGESRGILPTPYWKLGTRGEPWRIGDTINASIGQGLFLATPIQIARYTALIATGTLPVPRFAQKLGENSALVESKDVLNDFQKSKLPALRLGMYQVCNADDGTARYTGFLSQITMGCKTGTAQVVGIPKDILQRIPERELEYYHRSHGWITAFMPYKNPKYVITVLVEHGGGGSSSAGPILASLANKMKELGYFKEVGVK